jgi:hypothetical protein
MAGRVAGSGGADGKEAAGLWAVLLLPLVILGHPVAAGGWMLLTLPLAAFLGYRALDFIRSEGSWAEFGILILLSLLVCLPSSGDPSFLGILILVWGTMGLAAHLRKSSGEDG